VKQKLFTFIFAIILALSILPQLVYAVDSNSNANTNADSGSKSALSGGIVNCGNKGNVEDKNVSDACTVEDIFKFMGRLAAILIALAGVVAVFFIVKSGLQMVLAAGDVGAITKARKGLTNAVIGFVLVMIAFLTVNTILKGSLSLGLKNGADILVNPLQYIKGGSDAGNSPGNATPPVNQP
jgi:hypothetical protein